MYCTFFSLSRLEYSVPIAVKYLNYVKLNRGITEIDQPAREQNEYEAKSSSECHSNGNNEETGSSAQLRCDE